MAQEGSIETTGYRGSGDFNENQLLLQTVGQVNQLITGKFSQEDYADFDAYLNQVKMGIFTIEAMLSDLYPEESLDVDEPESEYVKKIQKAEEKLGGSVAPDDRIQYLKERYEANLELMKRRGIFTFEADGGYAPEAAV